MVALLALLLFSGAPPLLQGVHPFLRAVPAAPQGAYSYYLTRIEVTGSRRLSRQQVVALSGLKTGRTVGPKDVEAARMRLVDSGLFTKVGYRLRTTDRGYSLTVIFAVEEPMWQAPVFFDNFVGLTDVQLKEAVAAAVPTFDGFVPELPAALERVRAALQKLARDSGQPGSVTYLLVDDKLLGLRRYRYRLDRQSGAVRVCGVVLRTAADALREEMAARTTSLVGGDYSKDYIMRYAMQNLLPIERREGYLRARIGEVEAAREPAGADGCEGVRVAVTIEDGLRYRWQAATWNGNTVFAPADLDRLLGATPGDVADRLKIDRGIRAVTEAYRDRGYLGVVVQPEPAFDDAQRQVAYSIRIIEGGQFRMGKLEIAGLDPAVAEQVKGLWQLAEGSAFDASYPSRFLADARTKMREVLKPFKVIETQVRPDSRAFTVDVAITFKTPAQTAGGPERSFRDLAGSPL